MICRHYLSKDIATRFVICLKQSDLIHKGKRKHCLAMATTLPTPHESVLIVFDDGKEKRRAVRYNAVAVKLPDYDHRLYLVVDKGFGIKPMTLLTSCPVNIRKKASGRSLNTIWPGGKVMSRSGT